MVAPFDIEADQRFIGASETNIVGRLTSTSFPQSDEQPKNVLKIGQAIGESLNHYTDQAKQLYMQGKLSLAIEADLDNIGSQFNLSRQGGESDDSYRARLKALFSPRKVVKTYIEETANKLIQTNPSVTLFEPWTKVMKYDDPQWSYDIDDSYYWSPFYWRSGVLVVRSGITSSIRNVVDGLIAMGVDVLYEQFDYSNADAGGFVLHNLSWSSETIDSISSVDDVLWFDVNVPSNFDDPSFCYDISNFVRGKSYAVETVASETIFDILDTPLPYVVEEQNSTTGYLVLTLVPGLWYLQSQTFNYFDSISFSDGNLVEFAGVAYSGSFDTVMFTDLVRTQDHFSISETLSIVDAIHCWRNFSESISDSFTLADTISDGSDFITFGSGHTFGDNIIARDLDVITMSNYMSRKLEQFKLGDSIEPTIDSRILYLNNMVGVSLSNTSLQNNDLIGSIGSPAFIQTTSANAPKYEEATFNNGACVHFGKVANFLDCVDSTTLSSFAALNGLTIALTYNPVLDGEAGTYLTINFASQPMIQYAVTNQGLQQRSLLVCPSNTGTTASLTSSSNIDGGTIVEVIVVDWFNGSATVYRNGVVIITGPIYSHAASSTDAITNIRLGGAGWNVEFSLKELLMYSRAYSADDVLQLTTDMKSRGAII